MATEAWIASAARPNHRGGPNASFTSHGDYRLSMPAQQQNEAQLERTRAARCVHRLAADNAPEILDILGLAADDVDGDRPLVRLCPGCGQTKARAEFNRNQLKPDGCTTYCKPCTSERRRTGNR